MADSRERFVLITGASSGIGHACAARLAGSGFVVFAGVRKREDAERLEREGGGRLIPVEIDVTDEASIRAAAERVRGVLGGRGLDALVNNAGIGVAGPVEYVTVDSLRRQFDVNVFGQIAVTQAFLPLIRRARGRIVNIGSVGSHLSMPFGGGLSATKSAFRLLSDALRLELHPFGVHVSTIEPGAIRTPAVEKMLGDPETKIRELPPEAIERYGDMMRAFMHRAYAREQAGSSPEVVAAVVLRALTDEPPRARYLAGKDARLLVTLPGLLSDRLLDGIRYRLFGMPRRFASRSYGAALATAHAGKPVTRAKGIMYWITTGLIALETLAGGAMDLARGRTKVVSGEPVLDVVKRLGYPAYVLKILGIWKMPGAIALLVPGLPRLKEWAYAGIIFELTGAAASQAARRRRPSEIATPLLLAGLALSSWALRPASRRV